MIWVRVFCFLWIRPVWSQRILLGERDAVRPRRLRELWLSKAAPLVRGSSAAWFAVLLFVCKLKNETAPLSLCPFSERPKECI